MRQSVLLGLIVISLAGCSQEKPKENSISAMQESVPEVVKVESPGAWSAKRLVAVPLPEVDAWIDWYYDPLFSSSEGPENGAEILAALDDWAAKVSANTGSLEVNDEEVEDGFQLAVSAGVLRSHLKLNAGDKEGAFEAWQEAYAWAYDGIRTGVGIQGLYVSAPFQVVMAMGQILAEEDFAYAEKILDEVKDVSFVDLGREKLKEELNFVVLPRLETVAQAKDIVDLGTKVLAIEPEEEEMFKPLVDGAWRKDGRKFDGVAAAKLAGKWTEGMVLGLDSGWEAVNGAMLDREEAIKKAWGVNPFEMIDVKAEDLLGVSAEGAMLPVFFAYSATSGMPSALQSAMVTEVSLDATRLALREIVSGEKANADGLVDPLTRKPYVVDWKNRLMRTQLESIGEDWVLLKSFVEEGYQF